MLRKQLVPCRDFTRPRALLGLAALAALVVGCAAEQEVLVSDPAPARAPSAVDGGTTAVSAPFAPLDGGLTVRPMREAGTTSLSAPIDASLVADMTEICDGVDNDGNGIVDDRDVMHDGVCDCLKIATLGVAGGSGNGDIFGSWLDSRSDSPATSLGDAELTPERLRPFQIIVVEDLHTMKRTYSAAEVDALEAWVRNGGGLMTLIGYAKPTERTHVNTLLSRFGVQYGEQPILARTGQKTVPVTTWLGPHPVVEGVSSVGVDNGYAVVGEGTTLAREAGFDLLKVQEVGQGHLIVWGDEWITYDSEWSLQSDYQVEQLWLNMIKWLTVARVCQVPTVFL